MVVAKFNGVNIAYAYGLTQWDYGQELALEYTEQNIPDGTEINFYQGKLSCVGYIKNKHVMVPDLMLQNAAEITAYVYARSGQSGKTVLSIKMPVCTRPRPDNYVLPDYEEYKRLLPSGGNNGDALVKGGEENYDVKWSPDAGTEPMSDYEIDAICV